MSSGKKLFVVPSIMGLIVIGWILLVFWPAAKTIKALTEESRILIQKDKQSISDLQVKSIQLEADSLTRKLEADMRRLFYEDQLLDLGRVIEQIGKQYGLNLLTVTPDYQFLSSLKENQEQITVFPMTIVFGGTFSQFTKFLDNINEFPIVFQVETILFKKESESGSKLTGEMHSKIVMRKKLKDIKQKMQLAMADRT
jgi:Tfp pilus assembly protein PilO